MATVAFVSFCLKSRDSVASEAEKWIRVLGELGHQACRIAGYIPDPGEGDQVISELNHLDPEIESFTSAMFGPGGRDDGLAGELERLTGIIAARLDEAFGRIRPDLVIAGNIFSLPLNLPLSAALCRWLENTGTGCVAVHHDYLWDDPRFASPRLPEVVSAYIPAPLPQIMHVCMDAQGREELYSRSGLAATRIERCFDFEACADGEPGAGPPPASEMARARQLLFLQPARPAGCNCMERAASFVQQCAMVSGRKAYLLLDGADAARCDLPGNGMSPARDEDILLATRAGSGDQAGLSRLYQKCDAVIMPGACREFGNSLVESVVYRKPLLVADSDEVEALRSRGMQFLMLDERAAERIVSLFGHPDLLAEMVDRNFELGRKYFSLDVLRERVGELMMALAPRGNGGYS